MRVIPIILASSALISLGATAPVPPIKSTLKGLASKDGLAKKPEVKSDPPTLATPRFGHPIQQRRGQLRITITAANK